MSDTVERSIIKSWQILFPPIKLSTILLLFVNIWLQSNHGQMNRNQVSFNWWPNGRANPDNPYLEDSDWICNIWANFSLIQIELSWGYRRTQFSKWFNRLISHRTFGSIVYWLLFFKQIVKLNTSGRIRGRLSASWKVFNITIFRIKF